MEADLSSAHPFHRAGLSTAPPPTTLPLGAITDTNSARTAQLCSLSLRLPCSARARVISVVCVYVHRWILATLPSFNSAADQCFSLPYSFCFSQIIRRWSCCSELIQNLQFVSTHFCIVQNCFNKIVS